LCPKRASSGALAFLRFEDLEGTRSAQQQHMDLLPEDISLGEGLPQILILLVLALSAVYAFTRLFADPEAGVKYTVDEPEQLREGWEGEELSEPSIQVDLLAFLKSPY
jgi:hypothetical protein